MQDPGPHSELLNQNLLLNQIPWWFICTSKLLLKLWSNPNFSFGLHEQTRGLESLWLSGNENRIQVFHFGPKWLLLNNDFTKWYSACKCSCAHVCKVIMLPFWVKGRAQYHRRQVLLAVMHLGWWAVTDPSTPFREAVGVDKAVRAHENGKTNQLTLTEALVSGYNIQDIWYSL